MSSKYALSVSLTEHLCLFVDQQVASGRYRTASEVIREALRLLENQLSNSQPSEAGMTRPIDAASATPYDERNLHLQAKGRAL